MEHVIVERAFAEPVDLEALYQTAEAGRACYQLRRVTLLRSLVSRDRLRMICEYLAPDAESVREANERAGMPYERIWTARILKDDASV
jgi:hypothetical protein